MRKFTGIVAAIGVLAFGLWSCDETSTIGGILAEDELTIQVDSDFILEGHSIALESVRSQTVYQLLGTIEIPEYGMLSSSVVTQFLSSTTLDTANFTAANVDSLVLLMQFSPGNFIGDSIVPMGLKAYTLNKELPSPIFSDFNPAGYYDPTPLSTVVYNTSTLESDSLAKLPTRSIRMMLPQSLGRDLFQSFVDNPSNFALPSTFIKNVFPGLYIENSFGSGRMTCVQKTTMRMYLRKIYEKEDGVRDTLDAQYDYFMVTPEVLTNNNFRYAISDDLSERVSAGEQLVVAPCGYEVETTFPTRAIISRYRENSNALSVVNTLSLSIPADSIENSLGVSPPPYLLMVRKDKREDFFANNRLPDNVSSFYATYDSSNHTYNFGSMRAYIVNMLGKEEEITDEDCTFVIVPVSISFETVSGSYYAGSQVVESSVTPYVISPAMVSLKLNEAKIKFSYSLQVQK